MMIFRRDDGNIIGICGWVLINDTKDVNKLTWTLPEDITNGDILYITIAVLTNGISTLKIKKIFEEMGIKKRIKRVFWINSLKRKMFTKEVIK
jgi:hypothetical protein